MKLHDIFVIATISLFLSLIIVRFQIYLFSKKGLVAIDYYKADLRKIPTCGGISLLVVFFTILAIMILFGEASSFEVVASVTILLFGIFGLLDDFVDVGRITKVLIPISFSIPISLAIDSSSVILPFVGEIDPGLLYLLIPIYIMVVANLVNMHSGFNGLAVGLSAILILFLLIKLIIFNKNNLTFI